MELVRGHARIDDPEAFLDRIGAVGAAHGCTLQAFDGRYVAGRSHLERALKLADRARGRGDALARDRAVEVLCYAAGRRQIERALAMGVEAGDGPLVVLVAADPTGEGEGEGADEPPSGSRRREREAAAAVREFEAVSPGEVSPRSDRLRAFFDVGDPELAATDASLEELVCERVALLDVEK